MNNWYEILELEYYPNPVEDENVIKAKIKEKKEFWSVQATKDYENGDKYRKYLDLERKNVIENEMMDASKRKKMINELQRKLFETVDEILDAFDYDEPISLKVMEEFSKQTDLERKLMEIRIKEKGREIKDDIFNQKIYEKYCENLEKKISFKTLEDNLILVGKKDLYDFLNFEGIDARGLNPNEILKMIPEKRRKLVKSDTETKAKKRLFGESEKIFNDSQKIKEYDDYLEHLKYLKVSKELEKLKILSKSANAEILKSKSLKYIKKLNEILGNRDKAKNIFVGFCEEQKIPYTTQESYKNSQSQNRNPKESKARENKAKEHPKPQTQSQQKTNGSQNNENNNNQWNQNKQQKSRGTIAIWTIGSVLIFLLIVIIAVIAFKPHKDNNNIASVTPPVVTQPNQLLQSQPESQFQQNPQSKSQKPIHGENEKQQQNTYVSLDNVNNLSDLNNRVGEIEDKVLNGNENTLNNYNQFGLQIIRNSFYAKYGYIFQKNQDMINYFGNLQGYEPTTYDGESIEQNFSEDDKRFIKIVQSKEN